MMGVDLHLNWNVKKKMKKKKKSSLKDGDVKKRMDIRTIYAKMLTQYI